MERLGWLSDFAAVAVGGACGSMLRFALTLLSAAVPGGTTLWGTVAANLLGCFAIGALGQWSVQEAIELSPRLLLATRVGLLGGLTTFSTFAAETVWLAGNGRPHHVALYVAANLVLGLLAVWSGTAVVRQSMA